MSDGIFGGEGGTRIKLLLRKILLIRSALARFNINQINKSECRFVYTRKSLGLKTIHRIVLLTPSSGLVLRSPVL